MAASLVELGGVTCNTRKKNLRLDVCTQATSVRSFVWKIILPCFCFDVTDQDDPGFAQSQ